MKTYIAKLRKVPIITRLCVLKLCLCVLMGACTKTELVPYDKQTANRITEYKVTNGAEDLFGIIDNVDNTITVYIPYYISIDVIVPKITLEEGAKLLDKDGNEIDLAEDLEPVPVETEGYTYTVQDVNGIERKYTLKIEIVPFYQPLVTGYGVTRDANNNVVADSVATAEVLVNSRLLIYGNFESSSSNGKLTLINKATDEVVPDGLELLSVTRNAQVHYMTAHVSADVDSGYYYIAVEHQGRKDTLPEIHLTYKKPLIGMLNRYNTVGDTVTLNIALGNGVNTGISRMYFRYSTLRTYSSIGGGLYFVSSQGLTAFPTALYGVPIEVEIVEQDRSSVSFIFPDIPAGYYSNWINTGTGSGSYTFNESSLGVYFDFESEEWGKDNQQAIAPAIFEVYAKSN